MLTSMSVRLSVVVLACMVSASALAIADTAKPVNVQAGDLVPALEALAKQCGVDVIYPSAELKGFKTRGVTGSFEPKVAFQKLIEGTPLVLKEQRSGFLITPPTASTTAASTNPSGNSAPDGEQKEGKSNSSSPFRVAQATPGEVQGDASVARQDMGGSPNRAVALEEVIVTGTHIRGATSSSSPVRGYTRNEIDQTGASTVAGFVQRLSENFNGGASEGTISSISGGGQAANAVGATGINLRGLGNDSSLVLINGRRIAPGNTLGNFVDVSLIPLSAIERVDVMPDGASAIYGSDAIGGVVNFILRSDFEGSETRARYGSGPEGSPKETEVGQTFGHKWRTGSALLSYEYLDRTSLSASDRGYTKTAPEPFSLLPEQVRHATVMTLKQELSPGIEIFSDDTYSHRSTTAWYTTPFFAEATPTYVDAYTATVGLRSRVTDRSHLELSSSYADSRTRATTMFDGALASDSKTHTNITSVDAQLSGALWAIPAGDILYAVGAQYRRETFTADDLIGHTSFSPSRRVAAGFVELQVPLVGASSSSAGNHQLDLEIAARSEHYSDFGSTTNPKVGLVWRPLGMLKLRGSFGKAFEAPLLSELNPLPDSVSPLPEFDPRTGGATNVLLLFGGNPQLTPETARIWTTGFDVTSEASPNIRFSASYYHINFENRIQNAQLSGVNVFDALRTESTLGPSIVERNPPLAFVQQLYSISTFCDCLGVGVPPPNTIGAIIDSRWKNLATTATRGVDLDLTYGIDTAYGKLEFGLDGTKILKFDNQLTSTSPNVEVLNTPYNPIGLKLRGSSVFHQGPFSIAGFVNYVDSYKDDRSGTPVNVASWTTVDLTASYQHGADASFWSQSGLTISAVNVANRRPPFLAPQYAAAFGAINFDGANANVLGRFLSLQLSKRW